MTELAAGAPPAAGLEDHLAACPACARELAALREALGIVDATLASVASAEPGASLRSRIRQAAAHERPTSRWTAWAWPAAAAAALVVALVGPVALRRAATGTSAPSTVPGPERRVAEHPAAPGGAAAAVDGSRGDGGIESGPEGRSAAGPAPKRPSRGTTSPEVIVPAGEARAIARFAEVLRREPVERGSLLLADLQLPLKEPGELEVAPIEIEPLRSAGPTGS